VQANRRVCELDVIERPFASSEMISFSVTTSEESISITEIPTICRIAALDRDDDNLTVLVNGVPSKSIDSFAALNIHQRSVTLGMRSSRHSPSLKSRRAMSIGSQKPSSSFRVPLVPVARRAADRGAVRAKPPLPRRRIVA
jgi:hypothetical protein